MLSSTPARAYLEISKINKKGGGDSLELFPGQLIDDLHHPMMFGDEDVVVVAEGEILKETGGWLSSRTYPRDEGHLLLLLLVVLRLFRCSHGRRRQGGRR